MSERGPGQNQEPGLSDEKVAEIAKKWLGIPKDDETPPEEEKK